MALRSLGLLLAVLVEEGEGWGVEGLKSHIAGLVWRGIILEY